MTRSLRFALFGLSWFAVLVLTGCGGPSKAETRSLTTTTTHKSLAQLYTAVVANGDHRLQALSNQLNQAHGDVVAVEAGFRQVSSTYRGVARAVQKLPFPAGMHKDVGAMVSALKILAGDAAQGAESVTSAEFNLVFTNLAAHQKSEVTANTKVNHDLGITSIE